MVKTEIASSLSLLAMTEEPNRISHCEQPQGAWQSQNEIMTQSLIKGGQGGFCGEIFG